MLKGRRQRCCESGPGPTALCASSHFVLPASCDLGIWLILQTRKLRPREMWLLARGPALPESEPPVLTHDIALLTLALQLR